MKTLSYTAIMLVSNPEVVETIRRVRHYGGDERVRNTALQVYQLFECMFGVPEDQTFSEVRYHLKLKRPSIHAPPARHNAHSPFTHKSVCHDSLTHRHIIIAHRQLDLTACMSIHPTVKSCDTTHTDRTNSITVPRLLALEVNVPVVYDSGLSVF